MQEIRLEFCENDVKGQVIDIKGWCGTEKRKSNRHQPADESWGIIIHNLRANQWDKPGLWFVKSMQQVFLEESEDGGNHQRIREIDIKIAVVHKIVVHKLVYFIIIVYICTQKGL